MRGIFLVGTILLSLVLSFTMPTQAQKKGQSATVQYGKVVQKESVNLNSGAVPRGAVVGGALGLASAGGKSSKKKARNALPRRKIRRWRNMPPNSRLNAKEGSTGLWTG